MREVEKNNKNGALLKNQRLKRTEHVFIVQQVGQVTVASRHMLVMKTAHARIRRIPLLAAAAAAAVMGVNGPWRGRMHGSRHRGVGHAAGGHGHGRRRVVGRARHARHDFVQWGGRRCG